MPLAIPDELKKIAPFIRRAEELDMDNTSLVSRLIAYFCRTYALSVALSDCILSQTGIEYLKHVLGCIDQESPGMDNFPYDTAEFLCRIFAMGVFNTADAVNKVGNTDIDTAKTFYAAAVFLQILEQFYDDNNDASEEVIEDRRRIMYAKWKAKEIIKTFKDGLQPTPEGFDEGMFRVEIQLEDDFVDFNELLGNMDAPTKLNTVKDDDHGYDEPSQKNLYLHPPVAPFTAVMGHQDSTILPNAIELKLMKLNMMGPQDSTIVPKAIELKLMKLNMMGPQDSIIVPTAIELKLMKLNKTLNDEEEVFFEQQYFSYNLINDLLHLSFDLIPRIDPKPLPPLPPPTIEVIPEQSSLKAQKKSFFGFRKKSARKASKNQIADATEITRFALIADATEITRFALIADATEITRLALIALEEKGTELAAERLQHALQLLCQETHSTFIRSVYTVSLEGAYAK